MQAEKLDADNRPGFRHVRLSCGNVRVGNTEQQIDTARPVRAVPYALQATEMIGLASARHAAGSIKSSVLCLSSLHGACWPEPTSVRPQTFTTCRDAAVPRPKSVCLMCLPLPPHPHPMDWTAAGRARLRSMRERLQC